MNKKENLQIKEEKLKPIIPTLRDKKRFIKIKIESNKKYDFKTLSDNLTEQLTYFIGAIDMGKAGIWILKDKFDYEKQTLIIRVVNNYKDKTIAALSLTNKIENNSVNIKTLKVSGTLKGVEKEK